jgi:pilus assembly protein CpaE
MVRAIKPADARQALGRDIAYTIADEPAVMRNASEQGLAISEIKRRTAVGKDLDRLISSLAAKFQLER